MGSRGFPSRETKVLKGHTGSVPVIRFSKDGNYALSGGNDRFIKLWNPTKGLCVKTYSGHGQEVLDLCVSNDNSRIASCGGDRMVFLWDVASARVIRKFRGHMSRVNCVAFNEDNSVLVTGSYDKTVRIWDCKSQSQDPIQVLEESKDSVSSLIVTRTEIISGSIDGTVRRYDIRAGTLLTDSMAHPVTSAHLSHDGNCILVSCLNNTLRLIDKEAGELLNEYKGHKNENYKIENCLTNDDAYVIAGSEDNDIYVWDLVEASVAARLKGHTKPICGLSYHPREQALLSSSVDGTIRYWT